jgi:predicted DNA-binding protein with PD1-like motif
MPVIPPTPHFEGFEGGWEVFGMATIYPSTEGPKLHMHSALGRGLHSMTGCIRERAEVYLVVEAVLFEFSGLNARRAWDGKTGLHLPVLDRELQWQDNPGG